MISLVKNFVAGKNIVSKEIDTIAFLIGVGYMLARLSLLLDGEEIDYRKSSLLQGKTPAENICPETAE